MPDLPIMRYFKFEHLPPSLQEISRPFSELAASAAARVADGADVAETVAGLRKLLEAKDCIVRASLK